MTADNESEHTIFKKGKYEKNFTTVSNNTFKNVVLSWKAKGLLIYLLTLPDDWKISLAHLIKQAPDGRDSLMGGIMELRKAGHIKIRENQRREGKFAGVTYLVYEEPQAPDDDALEPTTNGKTATGKSVYGKTGYGKTGYGKSAPTKYLLNKKRNDNEILINKSSLPKKTEVNPSQEKEKTSNHQEIVNALAEATGMDKNISGNGARLGQFAKQLREAGYTLDDIQNFTLRWDKDWRAKGGSLPTLKIIREEIGGIKKPSQANGTVDKFRLAFMEQEQMKGSK